MFSLTPSVLISRIIILVIAFTLHEFSHAKVADLLGDPTPRNAGRLTLNPLVHLDPMGTFMLLVLGFGWAKPVPVNPGALRRRTPAGLMLTSLAGPASNLLLACLGALPIRLGLLNAFAPGSGIFPSLGGFFLEFVYINVTLFLFNLLPLSPLDGGSVLEYLVPRQWLPALDSFRSFSPYILFFAFIVGPRLGFDLFGLILQQPIMGLTRTLLGL
jgi:Zn-dependent protease